MLYYGLDKLIKIIQIHDGICANDPYQENDQYVADDQPIENCKFQCRPPSLGQLHAVHCVKLNQRPFALFHSLLHNSTKPRFFVVALQKIESQ
jgi:hypothetical protein